MRARFTLITGDARELGSVAENTAQLVVTSPPYPMIEMWDGLFAELAPESAPALATGDGERAFEAMHQALDAVWAQCARALAPGGLLCLNIGDATRTLNGDFRLYSNHSRALAGLRALGLSVLPDILWRKPTNAPNKFMGSGMLPAGAYVTYEHEYVLIARKGGKREFKSEADKALRRRSAYFWEERNVWFSDLWADLPGAGQSLAAPEARARSAAFPLELPWRLIHMFSLQGDTVLDPFLGTGTTALAALACGRSAIGVERDPALIPAIRATLDQVVPTGGARARARIEAHRSFAAARAAEGRPLGHHNAAYDLPVMTSQEVELQLAVPSLLLPQPAEAVEVVYAA